MSRIKVLPEILANQIAAGEVVQRPASIVKELVENSLDADARTIDIILRNGGKTEIRISDDGRGMDEDDAMLAFERHATSKISTTEDLDAILSFGFRGEALPSIASVSHIELVSAEDDGEGVRVVFHGGKLIKVEPVGAPRGTEITVQKLFFNTPARRKFLKTTFTEYQHCLNVFTRFATIHFERGWSITHNGNQIYQLSPAETIEERIVQLFGKEYAGTIVPFAGQKEGVSLTGFLGNLFLARSNRNHQYFFVNKRPVQNKTLQYGLSQVTKNILPKGKYPVVFVFLDVDPHFVDVNVHPAKTEVKFRRHDLVYDTFVSALNEVLERVIPQSRLNSTFPSEKRIQSFSNLPDETRRRFPAGSQPLVPQKSEEQIDETAIGGDGVDGADEMSHKLKQNIPVKDEVVENGPISADRQVPLWDNQTDFFMRLRYIGQTMGSFLIFDTKGEMILLDQHAAHERILFEEVLKKLEKQNIPVQHLLIPETIDCPPDEFLFLQKMQPLLDNIGFNLEVFGKNTMLLRSIPAWLEHHDPRPVLFDVIDEIKAKIEVSPSLTIETREELAKIMACKAAIKINRPLTEAEVDALMVRLSKAQVPFTCPHGRPIMVRFTFRDFEKFFKR